MSEHASPPPAAPSATVIVLRDADGGIEALLLRRNSKTAFHGGAWVFPGANVNEAGARHRLWMLKSGWRYEYEA